VRLPRPAALAALAAALLLATAGCGGGGDGGGDASTATTVAPVATTPTTKGPPTVLAIVSPAAGTEIKGNVVTLDVTSSGITITAADGDTSGHTGHYHVFVDREPVEPGEVIPVAADIIHTTDEESGLGKTVNCSLVARHEEPTPFHGTIPGCVLRQNLVGVKLGIHRN